MFLVGELMLAQLILYELLEITGDVLRLLQNEAHQGARFVGATDALPKVHNSRESGANGKWQETYQWRAAAITREDGIPNLRIPSLFQDFTLPRQSRTGC